jgi:hypothetical protein
VNELTILDAIQRFFDQDNWNYHLRDDDSVISLNYSGKHGSFQCYARAREQQQQLLFYSVAPINAPEDKRSDIAEFVTRANYGMVIGNFELDYSDGEVRYKTSIDVEGDELSFPLAKHLVYANVMTMDRYLPGMMRILYGGVTPLEAVQSIEAQ